MDIAKMTAKTLLRANRKNDVSYRHISKHGYTEGIVIVRPGLNHATLNKFALRKGAWIPADTEKQKLLGIYRAKKVKPKDLIDMSDDEILHALNNRKPIIAIYSQKAMNDFSRACKSASKARKATA